MWQSYSGDSLIVPNEEVGHEPTGPPAIYTYAVYQKMSTFLFFKYSLYFPCNTITQEGTSKPIAFLGSGNDNDDYLLQPHFVRKNFFINYFFHASYNQILE